MAETDRLILDAFRDAGWPVERLPFTLLQHQGLAGVNIVARKPGRDGRTAVVVAAHHDTVSESPGADDNASGLAALLELARVLARTQFRDTVLLAALDMEELGFLGAQALVPRLKEMYALRGALVLEMLGYMSTARGSQRVPPGIGLLYPRQLAQVRGRGYRGDFTALIYNGRGRALAARVASGLTRFGGQHAVISLRGPNDLPVVGGLLAAAFPFIREFARSDHVVFWEHCIPAVQLTDTADFRNPHYHRAGDTPDTLDFPRLASIVAGIALGIGQQAGALTSTAAG